MPLIKQLLTHPGGSRTYFSRSNDTLKQKIWRERIEPYIDDEIFKVKYLNLFTNIEIEIEKEYSKMSKIVHTIHYFYVFSRLATDIAKSWIS